jgi:hypothetical protein
MVTLDPMTMKKVEVFLLKIYRSMMFLLILDPFNPTHLRC